jgi:serine/threonine protein kinase
MKLLKEGEVVRDTYEVERFLGEGAFAEVYRVKHRFLGRQAMKVLKMRGMTVEEVERLLEEAILLSRIGHPNIIRVFDANVTETSSGVRAYFTMEYVAGGSLEQFWRSHGAAFVPVETALEVIKQVCNGLTVAHAEKPPIVHRDIKPQNILVGYDADGLRARITDFGLAKRVNPLTFIASTKGTISFKAPEAIRDMKGDSCAGDVWSLGTTFYLVLTDRLPFTDPDDSVGGLDLCKFDRPLVPPSRLNIGVDPMLDQIVFKALATDPKNRYQNARELLKDLNKWKPAVVGAPKQAAAASTSSSKTAIGKHSPADELLAKDMVARALKLSRQAGKLVEAADLMEEAFNKSPGLRVEFASQLKLWRKGIVM